MDYFLQGRQMMTAKPEGYLELVKAYAVLVSYEWEQLMAANSIHYINKTISEMDEYGTADYLFTNHAKYWSELKGFALAFQFNPRGRLTTEQFNTVHQLIGDKPVLGSAGADALNAYKAQLVEARTVLGSLFDDSADLGAW